MRPSAYRLTPQSREVLEWLLQWDRARIAANKRRNPDLDRRDYEHRQAVGQAALDMPPAAWPNDARWLFHPLLEIAGDLQAPGRASVAVRQISDGVVRARPQVPGATAQERRLKVIAAAAEIGVLETLQRTGSAWWRETKGAA